MKVLRYCTLIYLLIFPAIVLAWNIPGHMVSGAIAYRELKKRNPKTLAIVVSLLKKHPQYNEMFAPKLDGANLSAEEKDLYLFMLAARWPDDIKWTTYEPKHNNWHYINFPYTPPTSAPVAIPAADTVNIITAYHKNKAILLSKEASDQEKAVALCWLFHLTGDIHQPLHTAALFTPQFPEGDRGGNLLFIRAEEGAQPINLHAFWDGLLLRSQDFREADKLAVFLKNQKENKRSRMRKDLKDKKIENWAEKEGLPLASKYVYQQGKLQASLQKDEAPVVNKEYIQAAKTIAEQRIVLAGYRLCRQLSEIF